MEDWDWNKDTADRDTDEGQEADKQADVDPYKKVEEAGMRSSY